MDNTNKFIEGELLYDFVHSEAGEVILILLKNKQDHLSREIMRQAPEEDTNYIRGQWAGLQWFKDTIYKKMRDMKEARQENRLKEGDAKIDALIGI